MRNVLEYIINLKDGGFGNQMDRAYAQTSKLDRAFTSLQRAATGMIGAFGAHQFLQLTDETTQMTAKMEGYRNVLHFAAKDQGEYNLYMGEAQKLIKDYKMPLFETYEGFSKFTGAVKGTVLEGQKAIDIYEGLGIASNVLHLSQEKSERAQNALTQMISKGKVMAEEWTQQFGDAFPGANGLAARALGVTQQKFQQLLRDGMDANVFLPILAAELKKTYGPGLLDALDSAQAKMQERKNQIIEEKIAIGEQLMPVQMAWMDLQIKGFGILSKVIGLVVEYKDELKAMAIGLGAVAGAYLVVNTASKIYGVIQAASLVWSELQIGYNLALSTGLGRMAAAQWAVNVAMNANPVGMIITGVGLLAAGMVYAYQKSDQFRAVLDGIGEVGKQIFPIIKNIYAMTWNLLTLDFSGWWQNIKNVYSGVTEFDTGAYRKGMKASLAESAKSKKEGTEENAFTNFAGLSKNGKLPDGLILKQKGSGSGSGGSGGSGGSPRSITISFGKIETNITIQTINMREGAAQVQRMIEQVITRALLDAKANAYD